MSSFRILERDKPSQVDVTQRLEELLTELQDVNSKFPATREFLERRGLESVAELDRRGMDELVEHLQAVYNKILH